MPWQTDGLVPVQHLPELSLIQLTMKVLAAMD